MKLTKAQIAERDEAIATLRKLLKPGDTVDCVLRHVSRSGMSRSISLFARGTDGPHDLTYLASRALGWRQDKHGGMAVDGCGMDMGFHAVYCLGRVLFPNGFGVQGTYGEDSNFRPVSPEAAATTVAQGAEYRGRNGDTSGWDNDGGYALRHNWL